MTWHRATLKPGNLRRIRPGPPAIFGRRPVHRTEIVRTSNWLERHQRQRARSSPRHHAHFRMEPRRPCTVEIVPQRQILNGPDQLILVLSLARLATTKDNSGQTGKQ